MRWLKKNDLLLNLIITAILLVNAALIIYQWIAWGQLSAPSDLVCLPLWVISLLLVLQWLINWVTSD